MKTLFQIGSALNYGAPGKIAEQIGLLAIQEGWNVYQAHGNKYKDPSSLKTFQTVTSLQEQLHEIKSFLMDAHGLASTKETMRLVEIMKKVSPDLIHLHNIHGYFLDYRVLFDYLSSIEIPIVWTMHDCWPFTGHCSHYIQIGCDKWKTQCNHCANLSNYPRSLFIDRSERNYELKKRLFTSIKNMTIVTVSDWLKSQIEESFLKDYPIQVIPNGVDANVFSPCQSNLRRKYHLEKEFLVLGVASPWSQVKRLEEFMHLSTNGKDFKVVLIGLTRNQIKKLPSNILGLEKTKNQDELAKWYSTADVVLSLSSAETFGMTIVEGMACGTPAIVYKTTALPELIKDDTGIVVNEGDIEGIVGAINIVKKKTKASYSKACREQVLTKYNKDSCFSQYLKLYSSLVDK